MEISENLVEKGNGGGIFMEDVLNSDFNTLNLSSNSAKSLGGGIYL